MCASGSCSTRDYSTLGEQVFCAVHYLEIIKRSVAPASLQEQTQARGGSADCGVAIDQQYQQTPMSQCQQEPLNLDEENSLSLHREEGSLLDVDVRPQQSLAAAPALPPPVVKRELIRGVGTRVVGEVGYETDEQMMRRMSASRSFKDIRAVFERDSVSSVGGAPLNATSARGPGRREEVDLETAPAAARNAIDYFHRLEARAAAIAPNAQPLINFD